MKILGKTYNDKIASVYLAEFDKEKYVEFVESTQPPLTRNEKWVLVISTLFGCPIGCQMCDAGGNYKGKLTKEEIFSQIDHLVYERFPDGKVLSQKFKIQFCRMGEPTLNENVIEVLKELPKRYQTMNLVASLSTIAPKSQVDFLRELIHIKNTYYHEGSFQLQFSIHTTDQKLRDKLIPAKKFDFSDIARFGDQYYTLGDRKITLNFALAAGSPCKAFELREYFNPEKFLIKITPLNPTIKAQSRKLASLVDCDPFTLDKIVKELHHAGYEVLVSIGDREENKIGSNCGLFMKKALENKHHFEQSYTYSVNFNQS